MATPDPEDRPDYGIDAPVVLRRLVAAGVLAGPLGLPFLGAAGVMLWGSRVGKLRLRDQLIDDIIAGKRVVPYPSPDPDPPFPKRGLPDPKPQLKPDEWREIIKKIEDQLDFRGIVQFNPEAIAEIIKEALQIPTPDDQGPFDEDFEKEQRKR